MNMRTPFLLCLVLAALGLGGFAGAVVAVNSATPESAAAASDPKVAQALSSLESDVGALRRRLETLETRPAAAERSEPSRSDSAAKSTEPSNAPAQPDPAAAKEAALLAATKQLAPKFEKLLADGIPADDLKALMSEVAKSGGYDAAVAVAKSLTEKNPTDAKAEYLLARACYARCMLESTPAGFEKWGGMALSAWEKSAELDANYWEPRFERAEYLTYYPESEGKTPEVISAFEKLIDQQGGSTRNPRFARSYAHLARMYLRVGQRDKAIRTLRDGSALFPDDQELQKQLEVLR
jgi:tetratricopeptide (TPR) repeat protein